MGDSDRAPENEVEDLREQVRRDGAEIARLQREVDAEHTENAMLRAAASDAYDLASSQSRLVARLREEAGLRATALNEVREALGAAEDELGDLRAIRDALTPPELPECPGLQLGATFLPATQRVSGDFYLAARGPDDDSTVVVIGDVAGKGIEAARQAAFVRTAFATTARFADDPCRLLEWVNVALTERTGFQDRFATAACMTFDARSRRLRWGLAGHPPPLRLDNGDELLGARHGLPLGVQAELGCAMGETELEPGEGVLLYTDGLVEARHGDELFGVDRASGIVRERKGAALDDLLAALRDRAASFADAGLSDDLCLVAVQAG